MRKPPSNLDRVPPHNLEAEMAVLGSILLDNEAGKGVVGLLKVDWFYSTPNQIVYQIMGHLLEDGKGVDLVILREELNRRNALDMVGGMAYLLNLVEAVPSAANIEHYAGIVCEKAALRNLITASREIQSDAYDGAAAAEVLARAQERVRALQTSGKTAAFRPLAEVFHALYRRVDEIKEKGEPPRITTGFPDLDDGLELRGGKYVIVAALPAIGKSSLLANIVRHAAREYGCACFPLEEPAEDFAAFIWGQAARVSPRLIGHHQIKDPGAQDRLAATVGPLADLRAWVDDSGAMTPQEIGRRVEALQREHDIRVVIVDYLQLIDLPGVEKEYDALSRISPALKRIARTQNVVMLVACHLNREVISEFQRPSFRRLKGSSQIEQDADAIIGLWRAGKEGAPEHMDIGGVQHQVIKGAILKQRGGPTYEFKLAFDPTTTTFRSIASEAKA